MCLVHHVHEYHSYGNISDTDGMTPLFVPSAIMFGELYTLITYDVIHDSNHSICVVRSGRRAKVLTDSDTGQLRLHPVGKC